MEGWKRDNLGNLLELAYGKSLPKYKRVEGNIPVYGSNGIVGFHNVAIVNEPGIIVGRKGSAGNVRISKVPFCPIDTTFYITQQHSKLDLEYLYYALNFLDLKRILGDVGVPGLNREMAYLEELLYPSDKAEQRKIAHVLSTVQKAIEQQDKLIRTTTELKKALMQKLFTEGTRGEPQKETEIGLVPESWEVVKMEECLLQTQYGLSAKGNEKGNVPILRMTNQKDGYISDENLQYVNISEKELEKFKVNIDDVIFNRTNSFELVGRTAIFKLSGDYIFASYLIRLITNSKKLYPEFLNFYFNADETQNRLKSIATRGVSQSNISATRLRGFVIPLPSLAEQIEIISTIKTFNQKVEFQNKKKQTLTALFKTLLYELMTGQRRVHELEFDEMMKGI